MIEQKTDRADAQSNRPPRERVTTIVVSAGRTPYLEKTLHAICEQTRAVDSVLFVDVHPDANTDKGTDKVSSLVDEMADRGIAVERIIAPKARNFGEAVRQGLAHSRISAVGEHPDDLLWLLHDDSTPLPQALETLVTAVELSTSVVIAGPKQLDQQGEHVLEVGVTTSRFGRRLTGIEDGEVDQGQHDHLDDVFSVGTAGMLIRAAAWQQLGGADPSLGPYLDGLDLCRRARLAGNRVIVVPLAVVLHVQASQTGARTGVTNVDDHQGDRSATAVLNRRRAFLHTQLVWAPLVLFPVVVILTILSSLTRALWRVATKDLSLVASELAAPWAVLSQPIRIFRARRQAARTATTPRRALRPLQKSIGDVYREDKDRYRARRSARDRGPVLNQLELADLHGVTRRRRGTLAVVVAVLVGLTALVLGPLLWNSPLAGGALLPVAGSMQELWATASSGWSSAGLGSSVVADPLFSIVLVLAAIFGGSAQTAVTVLLFGSILMSGVAAWFAAGAATRSLGLRVWAALVWAIAPTVQLAMDSGRIGTLLAHATLPWVVLAVARALGPVATDPGKRVRPGGSLAAAAAGGIALAVASAGAPLLIPIGVVVLLMVALFVPRHAKTESHQPGHRKRLLLVLLPGIVLWAPYVIRALSNPRALAGEPGVATMSDPVPSWQYLLGFPSGEIEWPIDATVGSVNVGVVGPLVGGGVLVLVALLALFRGGTSGRAVRLGWSIAALATATAVLVSAAQVAVASSYDELTASSTAQIATGWPGICVSLVVLGLTLAAVSGWNGLLKRISKHSFGWRQLGAGTVVVLAALVPVTSAAAWVWNARTDNQSVHAGSSITSVNDDVIPAVAVAAQESTDRTKTLILRADSAGVIEAQLARGASPSFLETSTIVQAEALSGPWNGATKSPATDADKALSSVVAELIANNGLNPSTELATFGIGAVLVPPGGAAAQNAELTVSLDSTPGLSQVVNNDQGTLWWVDPVDDSGAAQKVGRVRIIDEDGRQLEIVDSGFQSVRATISQSAETRRVVLAERADPGWTATLDGEELAVVEQGWAQAFELPHTGGELVIEYKPSWRVLVLLGQGLVLLVCLLLAIPMRRRGLAGSFYQPFSRVKEHPSKSDDRPPATSRIPEPEPEGEDASKSKDELPTEKAPRTEAEPAIEQEPRAEKELPTVSESTTEPDTSKDVDPDEVEPDPAPPTAEGDRESDRTKLTQPYAPRRTLRAARRRQDEEATDND